jgi:hypothetical protein
LTQSDKGRAPRIQRSSRYGLPTTAKETDMRRNGRKTTKKTTTSPLSLSTLPARAIQNGAAVKALPAAKAAPQFKPLSDEQTAYGAKKYRTPTSAKQFSGIQGSAQEAIVLDIDGTLQTFGAGLDKTVEAYCEKHYKRNPDIAFLIVTARDHEYMFETSFNWCMRHFPYAFIGPFCRAIDDPRLASEFKRELSQGFEDMGLYRIVGAADDNEYVNAMWKHWAQTHFAKAEDFDLLEMSTYPSYIGWRSELPGKGGGWGSYTSSSSNYGKPSTVGLTGGTWVNGYTDPVSGRHVSGHWSDAADEAQAKHRPAGERSFADGTDLVIGKDLSTDAAWGAYLQKRYGRPSKAAAGAWPKPGLNVVSESPNGTDVLDGVIDELGVSQALYRADLEDMVAYDHPDWTPETIGAMTNADLREECGITNGDYRVMLYDEIAKVFGSHLCDNELEDFSVDEVEAMLDMTRAEIEFVLDERHEHNYRIESSWPEVEEERRRNTRMDLEDLVVAKRHDLTLPQAEELDTKDLLVIAQDPTGVEADRIVAEALAAMETTREKVML